MRINRSVLAVLIAAGPAALCAAGLAGPATAQEEGPTLTISRGAIALRVENLEPVGEATSFSADVGSLSCLTRVEGAAADTVIYHVWMRGDEVLAKVQLDVRSPSWRTHSNKKILSSWTGAWSVDVEDADGAVLMSLPFTIE